MYPICSKKYERRLPTYMYVSLRYTARLAVSCVITFVLLGAASVKAGLCSIL